MNTGLASRAFLTSTGTDAIGAMLRRVANHEVNQRLRHIQRTSRVLQRLFAQAHELEGSTRALRQLGQRSERVAQRIASR